jgi:putative two-component system response regulator
MPHLDGFGVLRALRDVLPRGAFVPVVALTADASRDTRDRALEAGAHDFLTKPFDATEVLLRIRNLIETRRYYVALQQHNRLLEERVAARTAQLEQAQLEILQRLALAAEFRDDATGKHAWRVGRMAALLGEALSLPAGMLELLRDAAPLHDVGKIGIPDQLLLKPGRLTPDEHALMQTHTVIGANLLAGSEFPLLRVAEEIALAHHERWNGGGYPQRQHGEAIPLPGRIVAIADVFDALTHDRPYKRAWDLEAAVTEIRAQAGAQFDPAVVRAFDAALPELARIVSQPPTPWLASADD